MSAARGGVKEGREIKVQVKKKKKKKKAGKDSTITQAEAAIERYDYHTAIPLLTKYLATDPTHFVAQELLANSLMETGHSEEALTVLSQCVSIHPKKSYRVWMTLGQLQEAKEALKSFQTGIQLMFEEKKRLEQKLAQAQSGEMMETETKEKSQTRKFQASLRAIDRTISTAYTTIVELYTTTELSDEVQAESECEKYVKEALRISSTNPDAHYSLANLRFIQEKLLEAESALAECVKLVEKQKKDETPFSLKRSVALLAVELKQFQTAVTFFELAVAENESDPQLLYGAGFCHLNLDDPEQAIEFFTRAKEVISRSKSGDLETKNLVSLVSNGMKQAQVLLSQAKEQMDDSEMFGAKPKTKTKTKSKSKTKGDDDAMMED